MFQISVSDIFITVVTVMGDIIVLAAFGTAAISLIAALLGKRRQDALQRGMGALFAATIMFIGLFLKANRADMASLSNGFVFGFSNLLMFLLLFAAAILALAAVSIVLLRRNSAR